MKLLSLMFLSVVASLNSSYETRDSGKLKVEIIEFDFSKAPSKFEHFSKKVTMSPTQVNLLEMGLKGVPKNTIIEHTLSLNPGDSSFQSTNIGDTNFKLAVIRGENKSGHADMDILLNLKKSNASSSLQTQSLFRINEPMIFPDFETSVSGNTTNRTALITILTVE